MDKNDPARLKTIAEGYLAEGYNIKALALYKAILRLAPQDLEVRLQVARLSQESGQKAEAMTQLHAIARHHEKTGDSRGQRQTLLTMVELEPENVAVRLKLVEHYAREGKAEEAGQELEKIGEYLPREPGS